MHTAAILAHFDKKAFTYYEVDRHTDPAEKKCLLSSDTMGPGVEMVRRGSVDADQAASVHAISVAHLGVYLAHQIERDAAYWMNEACCPACGTVFPAFVRPQSHSFPSRDGC